MYNLKSHQYLFIFGTILCLSLCIYGDPSISTTESSSDTYTASSGTSTSPSTVSKANVTKEHVEKTTAASEASSRYTEQTTPHEKDTSTVENQRVTVSGYSYVSATPQAASMTSHDVLQGQNKSSNSTGPDYIDICPSNVDCYKLGGECITCQFSNNCVYGQNTTVLCTVKPNIICKGPANFSRTLVCRYCYQTPHWQQRCTVSTSCEVVKAPRQDYTANCTVKEDVICLGRRQFYKRLRCNWTSGYKWSTALALSITLGGFGVDRFYLGLWREGIGKLFSFGGLGVWTLLDVVLIGTGYVIPADGSVYI